MPVALYLDENVHAAITAGLRSRGVDVVTAQEDGHDRTPDPEILDRATALGRVVFTQDADFLTEGVRRQAAGESFNGIVYAHQATPIGTCIFDLHLIAENLNPPDTADQVIYLPL